jgi:hypothetical protein
LEYTPDTFPPNGVEPAKKCSFAEAFKRLKEAQSSSDARKQIRVFLASRHVGAQRKLEEALFHEH